MLSLHKTRINRGIHQLCLNLRSLQMCCGCFKVLKTNSSRKMRLDGRYARHLAAYTLPAHARMHTCTRTHTQAHFTIDHERALQNAPHTRSRALCTRTTSCFLYFRSVWKLPFVSATSAGPACTTFFASSSPLLQKSHSCKHSFRTPPSTIEAAVRVDAV